MNKYLISLDKDSQRRALFFAQADTADFQIFPAVNTMAATAEELAQRFDALKFQSAYGRTPAKGEIGCTLSHLGVYRLIAENSDIAETDYSLICEDDALFNQDFQQNLTALLAQNPTADIILIGQSKINQFNDKELEINFPTTFSFLCQKIANTEFRTAYPYRQYFAGTVAYLIRKSTVKKILALQHDQLPYWLADDFILFNQVLKCTILIVRPLMVIENPKLNSNLQAERGSQQNHVIKKLLKYPLKKLLAVLENLKNQ